MADILSDIFEVHGYLESNPLSYDELVAEIDDDKPVIAVLRGDEGGHVVVISGYKEPARLIILDPLIGKRTLDYDTMLDHPVYGSWESSFVLSSERSEESACARVPEQFLAPTGWMVRYRVACQ